VLFDNGTARQTIESANSRGQVWRIDQTNMMASLVLNADLGAYSRSLGSAQLLGNGNYACLSGNIFLGTTVEVESAK